MPPMIKTAIMTVGELLVEFVSHQKGCALRKVADYSGPYPSGAPAIFIDQAARMGADTQIIGAIGADNFGNALVDRLQIDGVDTRGIVRHTDKTTGVAFVSYFDDGSRTFIFHLSNTAADAVSETDFLFPDNPLLLHVSGSSLGNPSLRTTIEKCVDEVLDRGGKISCDPNARAELMHDSQVRGALDGIMGKSVYLFPSTSDLEFLFPGKSEQEVMNTLHAQGADIVALKRGADGSTISTADGRINFPGHSVQEIDPTGAGDCFCGTFLAMIAQGHSPEVAGVYANAAGALAVTKRGPMEGNSSPAMIEHFLESPESRLHSESPEHV